MSKPEQIARVLATYAENPGATREKLGELCGVSKNTVVGILDRAKKRDKLPARRPKPMGPHDPVGCRRVFGEPGHFDGHWRYCQAETRPGRFYCDPCEAKIRPAVPP